MSTPESPLVPDGTLELPPLAGGPAGAGWDPATLPPHERERHDRTLAACGPGPFSEALVLGTGNGTLPAMLVGRCAGLVAVDPSATAAALASERLPGGPHLAVVHGALPDDLPRSAAFDLVVVSDVLCALPEDDFRRTLDRFPRLLRPGARVVSTHWCGQAPDAARTAAEAHRALRVGTGLRPADVPAPPGARGHLLDALQMR